MMEKLVISDYRDDMLPYMMQMFYDTVHTVNARDYNKQQLDRWAPTDTNAAGWKQRLNKNICKVAFINDVVTGFAELTNDGHIDTMYVHKDFQRRKIASNLIEELLKIAGEKKYHELTTEASITAKPFFIKYGFKVTRRKTKLHNGRAFVNYVMKKFL